MDSWAAVAAANNAAWCDVVCRTHGLATDLDDAAWSTPGKPPPLYPNAVTLSPDASTPSVLRRVDDSPGCSVKDSFASLDLADHSFDALFSAEWIVREPSDPARSVAGPTWAVVTNVEEFSNWEQAWRGDDGPAGVLRADLLDIESIKVLAAAIDGRLVGGAVLNVAAGVVGLSNVFVDEGMAVETWRGCVALASELFPGETLVGYEAADDLAPALAVGFESAGPLRVWVRP